MAKRSRSATVQLKIRMKEPLRSAIEGAALERGISLNAEAVRRLETSFEGEKRESLITAQAAGGVYASFGGLDKFTVMRLLANAISALELASGRDWREDPALFAEVRMACDQILRFFAPKDSGEPPLGIDILARAAVASESEHLGRQAAVQVMETWVESALLAKALRKGNATKKPTKRRR